MGKKTENVSGSPRSLQQLKDEPIPLTYTKLQNIKVRQSVKQAQTCSGTEFSLYDD